MKITSAKLKANRINGYLGGKVTQLKFENIRNSLIAEYNLSPRYCFCCNGVLLFEKRFNKYCSRSCSAKKTNPNKKKSLETRTKISESLKRPKKSIIKYKECYNCKSIIIVPIKNSHKIEFCKNCKNLEMEIKLIYRLKCCFNFDIVDYPEEFNLKEIFEKGFFNPKKNKEGYSRDHIYSIEEGFKNKIDPKIIAHPANCRVISQRDNSQKHTKCAISLKDLLFKIYNWNNKYGLPGDRTQM